MSTIELPELLTWEQDWLDLGSSHYWITGGIMSRDVAFYPAMALN